MCHNETTKKNMQNKDKCNALIVFHGFIKVTLVFYKNCAKCSTKSFVFYCLNVQICTISIKVFYRCRNLFERLKYLQIVGKQDVFYLPKKSILEHLR